MICPYICNVVQDNQDAYEYDDIVQDVIHVHRLVESKIPMKCAGDDCAAWQDGRCRYSE